MCVLSCLYTCCKITVKIHKGTFFFKSGIATFFFRVGYIPAARSLSISTNALDCGFLKGGIATCFFGVGYIPAVRLLLRSTKALDGGLCKGGFATCCFF